MLRRSRQCAAFLVLFIMATVKADRKKHIQTSHLYTELYPGGSVVNGAGSAGLNTLNSALGNSKSIGSDARNQFGSGAPKKPRQEKTQVAPAVSTASGASSTSATQETKAPSAEKTTGTSLIETQTQNTAVSSSKILGIEVVLGGVNSVDATLTAKVRQTPFSYLETACIFFQSIQSKTSLVP
jgi:hypothetical protein